MELPVLGGPHMSFQGDRDSGPGSPGSHGSHAPVCSDTLLPVSTHSLHTGQICHSPGICRDPPDQLPEIGQILMNA